MCGEDCQARAAEGAPFCAMTEQQRQEESEVLVRKVDGERGRKGEGRGSGEERGRKLSKC